MTDATNVPGATSTATEIAGQATDDSVPADVSRADDKTDSGTSDNDAGTGTTLPLEDVELPGASYDIGDAPGGRDVASAS